MDKTVKIDINDDVRTKYSRLDLFISSKLEDLGRNQIKKFHSDGRIFILDDINNSKLIPSLGKLPKKNVTLCVSIPEVTNLGLKPQNIYLDKLFEDDQILVINKPAGQVVHPGAGNPDNTTCNSLLFHYPKILEVGHPMRPGIVHRLDKGTSGSLVIAKTPLAYQGLIRTFSEHNLHRQYLAICLKRDSIAQKGIIETQFGRNPKNRLKMTSKNIKGKVAITKYENINSRGNLSLFRLILETGRTHQIRVHLSEQLNTPIFLDCVYGNIVNHKNKIPTGLRKICLDYPHPLLHAHKLIFPHPTKLSVKVDITAPLPNIFNDVYNWIQHEN